MSNIKRNDIIWIVLVAIMLAIVIGGITIVWVNTYNTTGDSLIARTDFVSEKWAFVGQDVMARTINVIDGRDIIVCVVAKSSSGISVDCLR